MKLLEEYYNHIFKKDDSIDYEELSQKQIQTLKDSVGYNLYVTKVIIDDLFNKNATSVEAQSEALRKAKSEIEELNERIDKMLNNIKE